MSFLQHNEGPAAPHTQSPNRRGSKARRDLKTPPKYPTRDEQLEQQIQKMNVAETDDFLMKKLDPSQGHRRGRHMQANSKEIVNNVFPEPKIATPPKMRIRPGVTDEDLRKIWQEDDRKAQEQMKMAEKTGMVDKMMKAAYPIPRQESPVTPRKRINCLQKPEYPENEPPGFKGLGAASEPLRHRGRVPPPAQTEPTPNAELKPSGRRKVGLPENQWVLGHGRREEYDLKQQELKQ